MINCLQILARSAMCEAFKKIQFTPYIRIICKLERSNFEATFLFNMKHLLSISAGHLSEVF